MDPFHAALDAARAQVPVVDERVTADPEWATPMIAMTHTPASPESVVEQLRTAWRGWVPDGDPA